MAFRGPSGSNNHLTHASQPPPKHSSRRHSDLNFEELSVQEVNRDRKRAQNASAQRRRRKRLKDGAEPLEIDMTKFLPPNESERALEFKNGADDSALCTGTGMERDTRAASDNFGSKAESRLANSCPTDVPWTSDLSAISWINSNLNGSYAVDETLQNRNSGDYQRHGSISTAPGHAETGHSGDGDPQNSSLSSSSIEGDPSQGSLPTPVSISNHQAAVDGWEQNAGPNWDISDAQLESDPSCPVIYEDERMQDMDHMSWIPTVEPNVASKQFRPVLRTGARQNSSPQMNPQWQNMHQNIAQPVVRPSVSPVASRRSGPLRSASTSTYTSTDSFENSRHIRTPTQPFQQNTNVEACSTRPQILTKQVDGRPSTAVRHSSSEDSARDESSESVPKAAPSNNAIEPRIDGVLNSIHKFGFKGLEDFVIQYFTADLDENSSTLTAQSLSRSRHLRELLAALSASAQTWSSREAQGFKDEITRSAEAIYMEQVHALARNCTPSSASAFTSAETDFSGSAGSSPTLGSLLSNSRAQMDLENPVRHGKKTVQSEAPELWSLLMHLVENTTLAPSQQSTVVFAIVSIITAHINDSMKV